jgi:hypothetical protein
MIDIHTHIARFPVKGEPAFLEGDLLNEMDKLGVDRAAILPEGVSPECAFFHYDTEKILEICARHPDRLIPFCNFDPRNGNNSPETDFSWVMEEYKSLGCKGIGEVSSNLYFDDPLCANMYKHAGKIGFPIIFHMAVDVTYGLYGLADDLGLPRLERMLQAFPETIFVGHAMCFWAEISSDANDETRGGYPKGPIPSGGRVPELMRKYPNLYGDISAGSGFNALSRDPEFGFKFLDEFQDRLLFGTDLCHVGQVDPIAPYLRKSLADGKISQEVFDKIADKNAIKLFDL